MCEFPEDDRLGGLGCNAGGMQLCRFCGFGDFANIECPELIREEPSLVRYVVTLVTLCSGTVETFDQAAYKARLASLLSDVSAESIEVTIGCGGAQLELSLLLEVSTGKVGTAGLGE